MWEFRERTAGHLTCGGVTIGGPPFYNLTITGQCYGDADDDGLHLYVNQPSVRPILPVHGLVETARRDLQGHKEKNVTLWTARIRPQHLDLAISCPLLNVLPYTGPGAAGLWEGFIPLSRAPGDLLTYRCLGKYSRPGGGGPQEGQVHCQQTDIGPRWNGTLALPCQLTCPANYQLSLDHTTCYLASSDTSPHGVTSASLM
ncbi:hypothetical protein Pcinc_001293 [Petrolisthes cinctipes]|uniref:Uncharacterized protein n=1 Tax=Petrolisthes cinctipes TaxID=88211 RepID=A0AAE1L628_PETCI|nr:hypothetical protein Pcinc_001293 [Petrolisthes cinctipes]